MALNHLKATLPRSPARTLTDCSVNVALRYVG
jgi:hypothetical protein